MKRSAHSQTLPLAAESVLRTLGERLRVVRRAKGLTQPDLAAQIGVSLSTMVQMEKGAPTVQIGFYAAALWALDLVDEFARAMAVLGLESAANLNQTKGARQ